MAMNTLPVTTAEILPSNLIRVETALSRYPVHRLAKHGDIAINIREINEHGEASIKWEVTHSPGPLAYKLDTLIVNRRIEEAAKPIPRLIKLGSERGITQELGLNTHNGKIKKSLHQNASTYIKAKITYKLADGTIRKLEAGFTRYSVIFTGEELPDGRKADAVYILLNDIYMQVINGAMTRPLDYDYLKSLPPASQRFYELLSYQMYAAVKNDRPRAKLSYSELCTYAPLARQQQWDNARPQLARIHAPHLKSGYISKVDFQDCVDGDGKPDWIMHYQPGPKARAEYRAFAKRGGPVTLQAEPLRLEAAPQPVQPLLIEQEPPPSPLIGELVKRGVTPKAAADLVAQHPAEHVQQKIEQFDWRMTQPKPPKKPAGFLVKSIGDGYAADPDFVPQADRDRQAAAKRQTDQQVAADRRRKREQDAHEAEVEAEIKRLSPVERIAMEAEVLAKASPEARENYDSPALARYRDTLMIGMLREHVGQLLSSRRPATADA
jgi:hypothetical protein